MLIGSLRCQSDDFKDCYPWHQSELTVEQRTCQHHPSFWWTGAALTGVLLCCQTLWPQHRMGQPQQQCLHSLQFVSPAPGALTAPLALALAGQSAAR